jgi:hypothetical protein
VTTICAVAPAIAVAFVEVSVHVAGPLGVPMPRPTATDAERVESVTLTVPACATVNVDTLDPCADSVPVNVSVEVVGELVDDEGEVMSLRRLHPALGPPALTAIANAIPKRLRHAFDGADDSDIYIDCRGVGRSDVAS